MADSTQCSAFIKYGDSWHAPRCTRPGKVQRDGKWFCGVHNPVRAEQRREKREAEWRARERRIDEIERHGKRLLRRLGVKGNIAWVYGIGVVESITISFTEADKLARRLGK